MMIQIDDYVDRNLTHDNISYNLGGQRPLTDVISDTAMVLRTFKLFGSDVRFSKGHPKELRAGFAVPRLRQLHPLVSAQCERSVLYCLKALSPLVWFKMATEYVTLLSGGGVRTEAPTVSDGPLDEFRQLMTGMYYLCWHTMKQAEELRFVTDRIGRDGGCDWHLGMGYPDTKHEKMRDFRGQTDFPRLRSDAFHCALHSFCPGEPQVTDQLRVIDR
ncbi:PREDICTED: uncharacterized protein LOC106813511 [Priapulus caudatus]|uniref:Uncharacterized protein LOC106813511 n=1 Tax=Priapulus caudatus TaxID=37621 RepID=A0ABM1ELS1_PRICU|nr:PREDICTED: uncharacterized protein LOC106813511 [Priapulus caudatus]